MLSNKLKSPKVRLIFLSFLVVFMGVINLILIRSKALQNKNDYSDVLSVSSPAISLSLTPSAVSIMNNTSSATLQLNANSNVGVAFLSTEITFNRNLVRLTKEPLISSPLTKIINVSSMAQANQTGVIKITTALDPTSIQNPPINNFSIATLTFGIITTRKTTTNVNINNLKTEIISIDSNSIPLSFYNAKLYLKKVVPTPTLVPTIRPTATPTRIPTSPTPTIRPTSTPTGSPTGAPTSTPIPTTSPTTGKYWTPTIGAQWQLHLSSTVDTSINVPVYDIDGFDNSASVVSTLHAKGAKVICYFSAGSAEDWRSDYSSFPASVKGRGLDGWAGETWLDIRNWDVLGPIMRARMDMCKAKGFDAVDPDNVDAYTNDTGFPLTATDQLNYNKNLAAYAHSIGLSIGLKNDVDQISALQPYFDWALNEQCFQYNECSGYSAFINAGKAVLNVEYSLSTSQFCPQAISMKFSSMKKNLDLDAYRVPCQ